MKINKTTLKWAFEAGIRFAHGEQDFIKYHNPSYKKPDFDEWYSSLNKKEDVDVIEEGWVKFSEEKPVGEDYYLTRTKHSDEIIADWWTGKEFTFNDDCIVEWKRK